MKKNLKQIVAGYFRIYPKAKVLYATDDGNVFLEKSPAKDHANKTKQKMHEFSKSDISKPDDSDKQSDNEKKQVAIERLKVISLEELKYNDAYNLATDLQLPLKDKKKDTVYDALKVAKKELDTENNE